MMSGAQRSTTRSTATTTPSATPTKQADSNTSPMLRAADAATRSLTMSAADATDLIADATDLTADATDLTAKTALNQTSLEDQTAIEKSQYQEKNP